MEINALYMIVHDMKENNRDLYDQIMKADTYEEVVRIVREYMEGRS